MPAIILLCIHVALLLCALPFCIFMEFANETI